MLQLLIIFSGKSLGKIGRTRARPPLRHVSVEHANLPKSNLPILCLFDSTSIILALSGKLKCLLLRKPLITT
jgi:hypothetical protein